MERSLACGIAQPHLLILTAFLPWPLTSGGQRRQFHLVDAARAHFQVTMVVEDAGAGTPEERAELAAHWPEVRLLPAPTSPVHGGDPPVVAPVPAWRDAIRGLRQRYDPARSILRAYRYPGTVAALAQARAGTPDLVEVAYTQMFRYLAGATPAQTVLSSYDVLLRRDARAHALRDGGAIVEIGDWRARRHERQAMRAVDTVVVTSEVEAEAASAGGARRVQVVPNGADPSWLELAVDGPGTRLLLVGWAGHTPNVDGVRWWSDDVVPLLPGVVLDVAGAGWDRLPPMAGVRQLGFLPDLRPVVADSIAVVPLRIGGGIKLKLAEAMAAGRAIVATPVAAEGLPLRHEREALIAESAGDFAAAVERLRGDGELRLRLGTAARAAVAPFLWPGLQDRMLAVYDDVLRRRRQAS